MKMRSLGRVLLVVGLAVTAIGAVTTGVRTGVDTGVPTGVGYTAGGLPPPQNPLLGPVGYARVVAWGDFMTDTAEKWCGADWPYEMLCWPNGDASYTTYEIVNGGPNTFPGLLEEIDAVGDCTSTLIPPGTTHLVIAAGQQDYTLSPDAWDPTTGCGGTCATQADELEYYFTEPIEAAVAAILASCDGTGGNPLIIPVLWTPSVRCLSDDLCVIPWDPDARGPLMSQAIYQIAIDNNLRVIDVYTESIALMDAGLFDEVYADEQEPEVQNPGGEVTSAPNEVGDNLSEFGNDESYLYIAELAWAAINPTALANSLLPTTGLVYRMETDWSAWYAAAWDTTPKTAGRIHDADGNFWTTNYGTNPGVYHPNYHLQTFTSGNRGWIEFDNEDVGEDGYKKVLSGHTSNVDGKGNYTLGELPLGDDARTMYFLFRADTTEALERGFLYGSTTNKEFVMLSKRANGNLGLLLGGPGGNHDSGLSVEDNVWRLASLTIDGIGNYEIWNGNDSIASGAHSGSMDTTEPTAATAGIGFPTGIGGGTIADGFDVAAALVYDHKHTVGDRSLTVDYFELETGETLTPTPAPATRGYVQRACGIDINRNGIWEEAADCDVCDGTVNGGTGFVELGASGVDPDADGDSEEIYYIDCTTGNDQSGDCGQVGETPCLTLQAAFDQAVPDGNEEIYCFTGVCAEGELDFNHGGVIDVTPSYTVTAAGFEQQDWEYPLNPVMLLGWDTDGDGEFPPYDAVDDGVAVIDGDGLNNATFLFDSQGAPNNRDYSSMLEMAHFTVRDFGSPGATGDVNFVKIQGNDYMFFHDLEFLNFSINRDTKDDTGCTGGPSYKIWNMNHPGNGPEYLAYLSVENNLFDKFGGWFMRGSASPNVGAGPIRVQGNTLIAHGHPTNAGCSAGAPNGPKIGKLFYPFDGTEFISNIAYPDPVWEAEGTVPRFNGFNFAQCTQGNAFVDNELTNVRTSVELQAFEGSSCRDADSRTVDLVISDSDFLFDSVFADKDMGVLFIHGGSATDNENFGDVTISDNTITCEPGTCAYGINVATTWSGGTHPGTVTITNNTIDMQGDAPSATSHIEGGIIIQASADPLETVVVSDNNVNAHADSGPLSYVIYVEQDPPTSYTGDDQCFAPVAGDYFFDGVAYSTLADWVTNSGADVASTEAASCP